MTKRRVQKQGRCEVQSDAPIGAVWEVVRDVTRTGEWSHECVSVEWLADATEARPGARFRGRNRGKCVPVGPRVRSRVRRSRTSSYGGPSRPRSTPTAPNGRSRSAKTARARRSSSGFR